MLDDYDNVWVGTYGGGVCYFDGETMESRLDKRDGLINNDSIYYTMLMEIILVFKWI